MLHFAVTICAQRPEWVMVFDPPNRVLPNIRPYDKYLTIPVTPIAGMQQKVSDAVAAIAYSHSNNLRSIGTASFIRTHPAKPYLCLLTAGHNFLDVNQSSPSRILFSNIAFGYRWLIGNAPGNVPYAFWPVAYSGISNVVCEVLGAQNLENQDRDKVADYELLAYPKSKVPSGVSVYQQPYEFLETDFLVPATDNDALFMIHHAEGLFQCVSELSNAHQDVARNHHNIETSEAPSNHFWAIDYWSNGSISAGTSGAALIRPNGGQPRVIGIMNTSERATDPTAEPDSAIVAEANNDHGDWISHMYKLSGIQQLIREKCGCSDNDALNGLRNAPVPVFQPTSESITSQSVLQSGAVAIGTGANTLFNYTHTGNIVMDFQLKNIAANIHSQNGDVILKNNFSALASDGTELSIGLITSYVPPLSSSIAKSVTPGFLKKEPVVTDSLLTTAEKILQQFKVYPSPTKGIVNIVPGNYSGNAYTIHVTDVKGNEVFREAAPQTGNRQIDISSRITAGGTYMLQVQLKGEHAPVTWKVLVIQ